MALGCVAAVVVREGFLRELSSADREGREIRDRRKEKATPTYLSLHSKR
jgi:hypothetical protein